MKLAEDDPFSPGEQYRLLIQTFDAKTEQEAMDYIVKVFGEKKTKSAKLVRGTRRSADRYLSWETSPDGFRAYVKK
mgnify:CR=1 FL=1